METAGNKLKTFWQRPEGVTGLLFLGGLIVGGGVLLYRFLPYIITLLENALHAALLFSALGAVLYVLLDKKFRNLIWFMYKSAMRKITSLFVQIDPIGILETYIEYLNKNLREMDSHISKLKGQIQKLSTLMGQNKDEMKKNLEIAEQAKKKGNMELVTINTRQYGRLEESNKRYQELLSKMDILYKVLTKLHKNSGYLVLDIENEVRMRKQERAAIRSGYSAMRSAMNIIQGNPDKKLMFDQAMDLIVDDISLKIGEMERFMEVSASFIESIDLQNGVYEQKGLELLEKMEQEGLSVLSDQQGLPAHMKSGFDKQLDSGHAQELSKAQGHNPNTSTSDIYKDLF